MDIPRRRRHPLNRFALLTLAFLVSTGSHADERKLTLERAIQRMESEHPEIAGRRAGISEKEALAGATPSLPPPTLSFGTSGSNGPLDSSGRMENSFSVSQMIPFPTKLTSESSLRRHEKTEAEAELGAESLKLRNAVKSAFFELDGARKKIALYSQKRSALEEHGKRLRAITLSDRIAQSHRIWIQTELDLIGNAIIRAKESERIFSGRLNEAMGIDPFSPVPELETPGLSSLPSRTDRLPEAHPELAALTASKNAAEAALRQSKSLWLPDFSVTYRNARRFDGLMPNYSEATIGVTLPFLFFWEPKNEVAAANARIRVTNAKLEKTRNALKLRLLESRARLASLREQISNYDEKILPQAEKRLKISHGLVPSDVESLEEHLDAVQSAVDLKIALIDLRVEYEKAIAETEALIFEGKDSR